MSRRDRGSGVRPLAIEAVLPHHEPTLFLERLELAERLLQILADVVGADWSFQHSLPLPVGFGHKMHTGCCENGTAATDALGRLGRGSHPVVS